MAVLHHNRDLFRKAMRLQLQTTFASLANAILVVASLSDLSASVRLRQRFVCAILLGASTKLAFVFPLVVSAKHQKFVGDADCWAAKLRHCVGLAATMKLK